MHSAGVGIRVVAALGIALWSAGATAQPVTIRFACGGGNDDLKFLRTLEPGFYKAHPNIRIKLEPISDNFEQKILSELAANVAPDVASFNANRFAMFADRGCLVPLDVFPDYNSPEVDLKGRYQNILNSFTWAGKLYCLPRDVHCAGYLFYNKRLFRAAGIPYPDGSWTWDTRIRPELKDKDFAWVMQRLTVRNPVTQRVTQYALAPKWAQIWVDSLLFTSRVRLWDNDDRPTKLTLTDPQVERVFQFAGDCANRFHWMPRESDILVGAGSTMQSEFVQGKIAMYQSGSWEIKDLRDKMTDEWDVAPFPRYAHDVAGQPSLLPGEGQGLGILAASQHPKEAWEWVKWVCGRQGLIPFAQTGVGQPSIRALAQEPGVWLPAKGTPQIPEHMAITDAMALRVYNRKLPDYFENGVFARTDQAAYDVMVGVKTAKEALAETQERGQLELNMDLRRIDSPPYPFGLGLSMGILIAAALIGWVYLPEIKRKQTRTKAEKQEGRSAYLFLIPWFFGLAFTLGPMIYSLLMSFADSDIVTPPKWRGLGNYTDALSPLLDDSLFVSLRQTLYFAIVSIPLGLIVSLALALLLNQRVRGVPLFRALYYIPSLASGVAMSLIWMQMWNPDHGLVNAILYGPNGNGGFLHIGAVLSRLLGTPNEPVNWLGNTHTVIPAFAIMGAWGAGAGTIIFLAGLQGISPSYYEAATLDGANTLRRFWRVTLPLLSPTVFFCLVTGIIGALQVFTQSFVLTGGGPDRATLFYMVWLYQKAFGELKMGFACALAWILFAIILVLTGMQLKMSRRWVFYEGELK